MEKVKIDFLRQKYNLETVRPRPFRVFRRMLLIVLIFSALSASALSYQVASSSEGDNGNFPKLSLFSTLKGLVQAGDRELKGEGNDRINFLLMGVGGVGHDGPQLSDTMIFSSIKPSTKEIGMISIPRDMTVPIPGYGWRKINHANAFGENKEPGAGPELASQVLADIIDQDIQYYVRVDFSGFEQLIDDIGGVDIYVDRSFTDDSYPVHGNEYADCGTDTYYDDEGEEIVVNNYDCRWESLSFQEGWAHMNGETALKYVRSRHGNNGESSDFARSRRQQKVILAVKEKVFSAKTFFNPGRINRILDTLESHIATNLSTWELIRLANEFKDIDTSEIAHHVLDASPSSPLYATTLNGAYVLLPKNDDWKPIQNLAENIFIQADDAESLYAADPNDKPLFVKVEIQNGTEVTGLAFKTSQLLDGQGFDIVKIGNAETRDFEHTLIYDLTDGKRPDELKALRDFLKADVTLSATGWLISGDIVPKELSLSSTDYEELTTEENIDFLIILGENSANLVRR